jgi:hypothetical protein
MPAINRLAPFPPLRHPDGKIIDKIIDTAKARLGDGFRSAELPPLRSPDESIADPGKVRLGDGFITAEFPLKK